MTDSSSGDPDSGGDQSTAGRTRRETICDATRALDILLVDDNPMNQQTIGFMVDRMGHETSVAGTAQAGIDLAQNQYFDIILMDIHLPDMNGMEATRILRNEPGLSGLRPILAITGDAEPEHLEAYTAAGMNGCVSKPVDNACMARAFDEVMGEVLHIITERDVPLTAEELAREEADNAAAADRDESVAAFLASIGNVSATGKD